MSEFAGNVTGTSENPVVAASRGNFFVANEDHGNEAGRKKQLLIWGVGILLVILGIGLLFWITADDTAPPELKNLKKLIGTTFTEAKLPAETVEYRDVPFELALTQWQELTDGFTYTRTTKPEQVFDELMLVGAALLEEYGDASDFDTCSLTVMNLSELREKVASQAPYNARWSWDLTERERMELGTFLDREEWPGRVAGYLIDDARFYLDMTFNTDPATETAELKLTFRVEAKR